MLDKKSERDLAVRWRKHGDVAARDELVLAHKPYADKVARAYAATHGVAADDLKGHAFEGLLKAAADFDPDLGWRFNTYYRHKVDAEVREACRKLSSSGLTPTKSTSETVKAARPHVVSFDEPIPSADGEDEDDGNRHDLVADTNALSEDDLLTILSNDKVRGALLTLDLTLRDRRLVEERLDGLPSKEIAAELGITRARVDQIWCGLVDRAAALLTNPRRAKHIKPAPSRWYLWSDRPPAELPRNISNISQVEPAWFKAQRWPGDHATFRTERRVEVVAGPALMPPVLSRWGYAHAHEATGLERRRRVKGWLPAIPAAGRVNHVGPSLVGLEDWLALLPRERKLLRIVGSATKAAGRRAVNTKPRWMPPAGTRTRAANRELLVSLGIDGSRDLKIVKVALVREKCWSYRKPMLTETDVLEVFAAIPPDAVEPALAKLNPNDQALIKLRLREPPMSIPAIARFRETSYAKTLPALYRAVKRLQAAAMLRNKVVVLAVARRALRAPLAEAAA
ncbi:MAG: sigma-70 family RNA polymerase sigma factor [Rhizobiales bacterium]|nr:sigma-70 family RNA polymerase sigma factor [Hyphomicrobiales bacterium]